MFNVCQMVLLFRYFVLEKQADTVFITYSNLIYLPNAPLHADAIVSCLTEKLNELNSEIAKLKAVVSEEPSIITSS